MQNKNNRNGSNHQVESMLFRPRTIKKLNEKKAEKRNTHTHQRKTTTTSKMKNIVTAATQQPNNVQHR